MDYVGVETLNEECAIKVRTLLNRIIGPTYVVKKYKTGTCMFYFWATEEEMELIKTLYDEDTAAEISSEFADIDREYESLVHRFDDPADDV